MQTVDLLERAIALAQKWGYRVRWESLMGTPGGACEFAGERWIFLDLALDTDEQLEQLFAALLEVTSWSEDELARRILQIPAGVSIEDSVQSGSRPLQTRFTSAGRRDPRAA